MLPINIKIKKSPKGHSDSPNVLNLNEQPGKKPKNTLKKYVWLLAAIILAESLTIAFFYYKQPDSPYFKLVPKNIIAVSYFDQTELSSLLKSIDNLPTVQLAEEEIKNVLNKAKIEFGAEVLKVFKDQMAFIVLPNNGKILSWMILAQNKESQEQINLIKERTEKQLKQNYNLTNEDYRQIQITKIQNLEQGSNNLYYASVKNYFILTNNFDSLKESIAATIN
jgi:hypothetical protein